MVLALLLTFCFHFRMSSSSCYTAAMPRSGVSSSQFRPQGCALPSQRNRLSCAGLRVPRSTSNRRTSTRFSTCCKYKLLADRVVVPPGSTLKWHARLRCAFRSLPERSMVCLVGMAVSTQCMVHRLRYRSAQQVAKGFAPNSVRTRNQDCPAAKL